MEPKDMTIEQIEERKAGIVAELDNDNADLDALEAEMRSLNEEIEAPGNRRKQNRRNSNRRKIIR